MQTLFVVIMFGLIGGVAVGLQSPLASMLSSHLGTLESVFIVHIGGAVAVSIPLLLRGSKFGAWRSVPWYAFGAGVFGVVVISAISYTIPRLGVAATITLIVAGQLTIGLAIDQFGLLGTTAHPMDLSRLAGLLILFAGTWLIVR